MIDNTPQQEPTMSDVLNAIYDVKSDVTVMKTDIADLKSDVTVMKNDITELKNDITVMKKQIDATEDQVAQVSVNVTQLQSEMGYIKSNMVTKDDLTKIMGDFQGELNSMMNGENKKVIEVVKLLEVKKVFSKDEAKQIYTMKPFPHTV